MVMRNNFLPYYTIYIDAVWFHLDGIADSRQANTDIWPTDDWPNECPTPI